MRRLGFWAALALIAGCGGGGGGSESPTGGTEDAAPTASAPAPLFRSGPRITAALTAPFDLFYVEEFDLEAVRAVRQKARFAAQAVSAYLTVPGHPLLDGTYRTEGNAFEAARIDYAHSVGLTGAGEIVSLVDTPIRTTHDEFTGKTILTSEPTAAPTFHGTAVASIIAGSDDFGQITGVAPDAGLHSIHLPTYLDFSALAAKMDEATAIGAVASNNSWGISNLEIDDIEPASYWSGTSGRRRYVESLRSFAENGVIVFAAQNDYGAESIDAMHAIPLVDPEIEKSWLSVINVIPTYDEERITDGIRVSSGCNEAAPFCIAASGQVRAADASSDTGYSVRLGASFAAPQVSGAVALLAEAFPTLTASQLRDRLLVSADNGWFTHDGVTEFAPGLTHNWSTEFGHGFLDLRAALLPLGQVSTPSAEGAVALDGPVIISGAGAGDAIARSLAAAEVVIDDSMGGRFTALAETLAATTRPSDDAARALLAVQTTDLSDDSKGPELLAGRVGDDLLGVTRRDVLPGPLEVAALMDDEEIAGFSVSGGFGTEHSRMEFGISAADVTGSMLGITVPGEEDAMRTRAASFTLGASASLGSRAALHFEAEFGLADGPGAGLVSAFEDVGFSSYGAAFSFADVFRDGDGLTVFARRPAAISRGTAALTLARPAGLGGYELDDLDVGLAPEDRQTDIGFEYTASLRPNLDMAVGLKHSLNPGNVADDGGTSGVIGFRMQF